MLETQNTPKKKRTKHKKKNKKEFRRPEKPLN